MKAKLPKLCARGAKVLEIMETYGTNTQGPKYKMRQQAAVIVEFFDELQEARNTLAHLGLCKNVCVMPS